VHSSRREEWINALVVTRGNIGKHPENAEYSAQVCGKKEIFARRM
jgi:hypothetical protein